MIFTTFTFLIFLPIVFGLYWFVFKGHYKVQNVLILVASYFFYGWWDWRFLSLIAFSTLLDFFIGIAIGKTENERHQRYLLWLSLSVNLGLLGFFKYYNFFIESWVDAWGSIGVTMPDATLSIILPVGISFYTFQTLSYSLDIYKGRLEPTRDFISFAAFVSFFPQLVAGPIERAVNFLPQVTQARKFDGKQAADGLRLMLWGMVKKVLIADQLAVFVDSAFAHTETASSLSLILGAIYFTVQIYCDFSGYSDIAIGVAKLFGFELMSNFRFPLFSRSIPELWARWHISLTTWLNDYVFTPISLQLRNYRRNGIAAAIVLTFLVSGLWHGAEWSYVFWGLLNGLFFVPYVMKGQVFNRDEIVAKGKLLPKIGDVWRILMVFGLYTLTLIFFRAKNMPEAILYLKGIFTHLSGPIEYRTGIFYVLAILILDWLNREDERNPKVLRIGPPSFRLVLQVVLALVLFFNMLNGYKEFIYFDF